MLYPGLPRATPKAALPPLPPPPLTCPLQGGVSHSPHCCPMVFPVLDVLHGCAPASLAASAVALWNQLQLCPQPLPTTPPRVWPSLAWPAQPDCEAIKWALGVSGEHFYGRGDTGVVQCCRLSSVVCPGETQVSAALRMSICKYFSQ